MYENKYIKFIPLKAIETKKKIDVITLCLFKPENAYRSFHKYSEGLKRLLKEIEKASPEEGKRKRPLLKVRIFFDKNVYDDENMMKIFMEEDIIEPIFVYSETFFERSFREKDVSPQSSEEEEILNIKGNHRGLFIMPLRYIPFFDFKENKNIRYIISIDIDFPLDPWEREKDSNGKYKEYTNGKDNFLRVYYRFLLKNYESFPEGLTGQGSVLKLFGEKKDFFFDSFFVVSNNLKFDKSLLDDFLDIYSGPMRERPFLVHPKSKKTIRDFDYGMDDIFFNIYVVKKSEVDEIHIFELFTPNSFFYHFYEYFLGIIPSYKKIFLPEDRYELAFGGYDFSRKKYGILNEDEKITFPQLRDIIFFSDKYLYEKMGEQLNYVSHSKDEEDSPSKEGDFIFPKGKKYKKIFEEVVSTIEDFQDIMKENFGIKIPKNMKDAIKYFCSIGIKYYVTPILTKIITEIEAKDKDKIKYSIETVRKFLL